MPLDPKTLPRDIDTLHNIVVDLAAQLDRESAEKNKYRDLIRELLDAQRARKSEQLSKQQAEPSVRSGLEGAGPGGSSSLIETVLAFPGRFLP